MYKMVKM
jgi:hypothetical protein